MRNTEEDIRKACRAGMEKGAHRSYYDAPLDEDEFVEELNSEDGVSKQSELLKAFVDYAKGRSIRDINIDDDTILYFLEDSNCG